MINVILAAFVGTCYECVKLFYKDDKIVIKHENHNHPKIAFHEECYKKLYGEK